MKQECELFILRDETGRDPNPDPILYAPLNGCAARINEAAVAAVGRRLHGLPPEADDGPVIAALEENGFFEPGQIPENVPQKPVQVTLFPTDGCNLRCRYCYAGAEKQRHVLSVEAGRAAIDYVAANALELKNDCFIVGFHGNGEPFHAFSVLKELCIYAKEKGEKIGIPARLVAATNGVLNEEQTDWLLAWFDSVNISFDGLEDLQNLQRPMADGRGSFAAVDRTLSRLNESGKSFGIRTTLTMDTVDRLEEAARFVADHYPNVEQLHIEPAWEAGRGLQTGIRTPDTEVFIQGFLNARDALADRLRLVFSSARADHLSDHFCGAADNGFTVTAEGNVTACYEACECSDSRSETYIYGRYNPEKGCFDMDGEKMARLNRLTVGNMPHCSDCFCKYHCSGDCPAKLLGNRPPEEHAGSQRCRITRAITYAQIADSLFVNAAEEAPEES